MQVILEPVQGRVRASSGAPLDIQVEASDEEGAMAMMLGELQVRLKDGAKIVEVDLPISSKIETNPWIALHGIFKDDPLFEEWQAAIKEYREQRNEEDGPW